MIVGQQCPPILKGLCNPAQGRPVVGQRGDGPTLGRVVRSPPTLNAVASNQPARTPELSGGGLLSNESTSGGGRAILPPTRFGKDFTTISTSCGFALRSEVFLSESREARLIASDRRFQEPRVCVACSR